MRRREIWTDVGREWRVWDVWERERKEVMNV
jgi:hypothetical protein